MMKKRAMKYSGFFMIISVFLVIVLAPTGPVRATVFTFNPVADAPVREERPDSNLGGFYQLKALASPENISFLRFNVQNLDSPVTNATLRLYAIDSSASGITAQAVADNSWGEMAITYNNAPPLGNVINSSGAIATQSWAEIDVTSYITGEGLFSVAIVTMDPNLIRLSSKEGTHIPELVVETDDGPPTPPPTLNADFTAAPVSGNVPLLVNFTDNSTGSITAYDWDFGDGSSSTQPSPNHTYTDPGIYSVSLTVTEAGGGQDTRVRPNYIVVNPASATIPNASPVITITSPLPGAVVGSYLLQVGGQVSDDGAVQSVLVNDVPANIIGSTFSANITVGGGNQTINAIAEDDAGALGFDSTVVRVDDEGPLIDIDQPPHRRSVYTLTPNVAINYHDFLDNVNAGTVLVQLTDANNVTTDVSDDLTVTAASANGTLSTPLLNNSSYTLTVTVADGLGNSNSLQSIFYTANGVATPPEPANGAWASGVVYDSGTCNEHLTTCAGLPGVQVTAAEIDLDTRETTPVSGTIVSGPDGFFAFPFDKTGFFTLRFEKDGFTYGQREVAVVRERSTATNAVYLTPLDTAVTLCDNNGCTHANSDDTIRLDIPAGAIPAGETVTVTATLFDQVEFLPGGELPPGTWETYAFNLGGDSEAQFTRPVTVSVRNDRGFAPGTRIPLGYWSQETVQWEHAGSGMVDDTGQWVVMHVTHFSNYDCNDPVVSPDFDGLFDLLDENMRDCSDGEEGCFINLRSGELREWVETPPVNVLGDPVAPTLSYNTSRANPSALIDVKLELGFDPANVTLGDYIQYELFIEGQSTAIFTLDANLVQSGEIGHFRYLWDGRNAFGEQLPPGVYEYAVKMDIPYTGVYCYALGGKFGNPPDCVYGNTGVSVTVEDPSWALGTVKLNSQVDSALGQGWVLEDHQQVIADEAGRVLVAEDDNLTEYYSEFDNLLNDNTQYATVQSEVVGPAAAVPVPPLPLTGTLISEDITADTRWLVSENPYIISEDITVTDGISLTIDPGVQVMFHQYKSLVVAGNISAIGTMTDPITFTAYSDGPFITWEKYGSNLQAHAVTVGEDGDIWFVGFWDDGSGNLTARVRQLKSSLTEWNSFSIPGTVSPQNIFGSVVDSLGQVWIATDDGVAMLVVDEFDNPTWTFYKNSNSDLLSDLVLSVGVDGDDNIWFGTDSGVSQLTPSGWNSYTTNDGLASNVVYAIEADNDGDMWFGTDSGLSRWEPSGTWTTFDTTNSAILGDVVDDIAVDNENNVWMVNHNNAGMGLGISSRLATGDWLTYTVQNSGLASPFVRSIAVDSNGRKWIGYEMGDGVTILSADNLTWDHETTPRLAGDEISDIAPAPTGDVWLAHGVNVNQATRAYGGDGVFYDGTIQSGFWNSLQIGGGAIPDDSNDSRLNYVTIEAAGADLVPALYLYQSSPSLDNLTIWGSGGDGLYAFESEGFTLTDSNIYSNRINGVHINSQETGNHTLDNVTIQLNQGNGLQLTQEGNITVSNTTIAGNRFYGIYSDQYGITGVLTLQNSTIQDNEIPARLSSKSVLNNNEWLDNKFNQIEWVGGIVQSDQTWPAGIDTFKVLGTLTIADDVTLTIPPGATVLFGGWQELLVNGELVAEGTFEQPIYLGGLDGTNWSGVDIGTGSPDSDQSRLKFVIFQNAFAALSINGGAATLEYLTFVDNDEGLVVNGSDNITISQSNFARNGFGLRNLTPSQVVTAVDNYWEHEYGPTHPMNPLGNGQNVSDGVLFTPWRGAVFMDGLLLTLANGTSTDVSRLELDPNTDLFVRRLPNSEEVHFNSDGQHDYTQFPDGRRLTYNYNASDSTIASMVITHTGTTYAWTWDFTYNNGRLTGITDPLGRATNFVVDANGQLTQVAYPDGSGETFFYDSRGLITQHVDQDEAVTTYTYDEYGRVTEDTGPGRELFDPLTGQTTNGAQVRAFTPSDTSYHLINNSPVGDPDNPAPGVPQTDELEDRVTYGIGQRIAHTNEWGHVVEQTDSISRTIQLQRDEANRVTRVDLPGGDCIEADYDEVGNILYADRIPADQCVLAPENRDPDRLQSTTRTYESRFNQVQTITNADGDVISYVYDYEVDEGEAGRLAGIEFPPVPDEYGNMVTPTLAYTYNALGLIETETDERGTVTRYSYTQGTVGEAGTIFAAGVTPVPGYITQVIDDDGGFGYTTNYTQFDALGNPQTVTYPGGHQTHALYDDLGRVISETNVYGIVTIYEYDGNGQLTRQVDDYTADGVTGANVATIYEYDGDGRLIHERTEGDDQVLHHTVRYDVNGRMVSELDAQGHEIRYIYDDAGQLIEVIDPTGASTSYTYTDEGLPESQFDAEGNESRRIYDDFGRVSEMISANGELNLTTTYTYTIDNLITQTQAPDGTLTCFEYNALGQRTRTVLDCGAGKLNLTTDYAYDISGNTVFVTDTRGIVNYTEYDALNRMSLSRQDDGGLNYETTTTFDPVTGNVDEVTAVDSTITKYFYDSSTNRLTSVCRDYTGLNLCTSYTYDRRGRQETITDAEGVVQQMVYNDLGLALQEIADVNGLAATISYEYDNLLNLIRVSDSNGNDTRYTYTPRNAVETELYADSTAVSNSYDPQGNLFTTTLQDGAIITRTYDAANRQTRLDFSSGGFQSFEYDDAGRMTQAVQTMAGHNTVNGYGYDATGNVITTTQQLDGGTAWLTQYAYDYSQGERTITYPSGAVRTYQLDTINRLQTVATGGGGTLANYGYDVINHFNTIAYDNTLTNRVDYDALGRVLQVRINDGSSDVVDYTYTYDNVGNRTSLQRNHRPGQPADVYEYDGLYQLVNVWYGADATDPANITTFNSQQTYDLDLMGNRLSLTEDGNTAGYGPNDGTQLTNPMNRYDMAEGAPIGYDVRGNTLTDGQNVYTYDVLNRQTSVTNGNGTTEYIYDARGRRVAKVNDSSTTHFIYDSHYRVIEERDETGALAATYTYGQGMDEPLTMTRGGQTYYYHRDALGNITEVSNSSGVIIERYEYDVYGAASIFDGSYNPLTASSIGNPYLFTGRRYDPESGNYYYRARVYNPDLGRFLSMDPLGFDSGDYNLYRYALNNPTNLTDPTGEFAFIPFLVSAATEAAVDALMQATINYFFDPNITTIGGAFGSIDWAQVAWAGVTGVLPGGRLARAAITAVGDVIIEALRAWSNCEEYSNEQALFTFAFSIAGELVGEQLGELVIKYGKDAVAAGLRRLGLDEAAERLLRNADEVADNADDNIDGPSVCGINSFSEDTMVMTNEGPVPISQLEVGDIVLAFNEATGETDYYPVVDTISHEDPVVQHLTLDGEIIITTPNHPFYTTDGEWMPAGQLHIGDLVRQADSSYGVVQASQFVYQPQPMYNLTVSEAHTYLVGDNQWIVHNTCNLTETARQYALEVSRNATSNRSRPSTVAVLSTPDGQVYYGKSGHGSDPSEAVLNVLNQHPFNFGCAEIDCINQAQAAGSGLSGANITTIKIRGPLDNPTLTFHPPCEGGCSTILERLGINVVGGE